MKEEHSSRLQDVRTDLQDVQDRIQRIEDDLRALAEEPALTNGHASNGSAALDLAHVNDSLKALGSQQSQEEILAAYLSQCEEFFERGVLFLRKDSRYVAWKSMGFDEGALDDVAVDAEDSAILEAARKRSVVRETEDLQSRFPWLEADEPPSEVVCLPLVFDDSAPVVLYADGRQERGVDADSLELLTQLAVLVLKNHYLSYLSLQPTSIDEVQVRDLKGSSRPESAEVALGTPEENGWDQLRKTDSESVRTVDEEDDDPLVAGIPPFSGGLDEDSEASTESVAGADREEPDDSWDDVSALSENEAWDSEDSEDEVEAGEAADEAIDEAGRAAREALEHAGESAGPESLPDDEAVPPAGTSSEWLSDRLQAEESETTPVAAEDRSESDRRTPSESEEAPHNEARRFARLLVSEIKLYNVDSIEQGRRDKDLYDRLQRDIDRSRDMYEKRVHPTVRRETDYFHEEVLRILAGGDQDALGAGYPGPQIEGD